MQTETLARISAKTRPGYGIKQMDGWTRVFCCLTGAPVIFYRNLARMAGVHLLSKSLAADLNPSS